MDTSRDGVSPQPVPRFSIATANNLCPDHDYWNTVSNLETIYDVDEQRECWSLERVLTEQINPNMITDDPDDDTMERNIERIREGLRDGGPASRHPDPRTRCSASLLANRGHATLQRPPT